VRLISLTEEDYNNILLLTELKEENMGRVVEFHGQGYNCAESILKCINEEKNLSIPVSIGSPFGGGMMVGDTCGAITGALIAMGMVKGRENGDSPNNSRNDTRELMNKVKEKYGTLKCMELKKNGVACNEIIQYAYDILAESIE
jgi:C_GCAxxG_C_C family probable redox protein